MEPTLQQLSTAGRAAAQEGNWAVVGQCASRILEQSSNDTEGLFLQGLAHKGHRRPLKAAAAFERVLEFDAGRYDAAVELAAQYSAARRNGEVAELLDRYASMLGNSPLYLNMAGALYTQIGLAERGLPLLARANDLQPGIDLFEANLATCYLYLGRLDEARDMHARLLERNPAHQRNHFEYSRLKRATDDSHTRQMQELLVSLNLPPEKNVFLYYAIGKELEDLERWDEAFDYYRKGGEAVCKVANYDVAQDEALIDTIIDCCSGDWLAAGDEPRAGDRHGHVPIFVTGLPRTGTTLTERIVSSHSAVRAVGEPQFLQMAIRKASGVQTVERMSPAIVRGAAAAKIRDIGDSYIESLKYRLGDTPMFVDKLPFNFLFAGFIAKAWPDARIVVLRRHPMDSCFAMYKQVFTWAYQFSYDLAQLGRYYIAHEKLFRHWQAVLGERLVVLEYETLVAEQEAETRRLLDELGLPFEQACLDFDRNPSPTATASAVQVREKIHNRSVARWQRFATGLEPLRRQLAAAGIAVDPL